VLKMARNLGAKKDCTREKRKSTTAVWKKRGELKVGGGGRVCNGSSKKRLSRCLPKGGKKSGGGFSWGKTRTGGGKGGRCRGEDLPNNGATA